MKFIKEHKKIIIIGIIILVLFLILLIYNTVYLDYKSPIVMNLKGNKTITIKLNEEYKENGVKVTFRNKDITTLTKINSNINNKKIGNYIVEYKVKYKNKIKIIKRNVKVIDDIKPEITLNGDENISIYVGNTYNDLGAKATDNYDGDITDKIKVTNNLDVNKVGVYEFVYSVKDTSGNENTIKRKVEVKERPIINSKKGVAVLNYHFFFGEGENCNQGICLSTVKFEEQLKYLKENNYKTLTMDEFVKWMYGEIEIPDKSVLLTIDDGAMGTGFHNGNKLIPLLEKYQIHATLFLITGWWDISNYKSSYLDVESHTNDMHTEGKCSGVSRGAQMLCSNNEAIIEDLNKSISITGSKKAFCYPFYAYDERTMSLVKQAGFKVAFAGGSRKATRNSNKYAIPRYPIQSSITLNTFINIISS